MDKKKPWTVDPTGKVDTGRRTVRDVKWGQLLSFGCGAFCVFGALKTQEHIFVQVGGLLMALGIAFRVISVWEAKR